MIKYFKIIALIILFFLLVGFTGKYLYKINKSFDLFAEVIELISNNYVLDIDPEIFVEAAIHGMLETLDPYTDYYNEKAQQDLKILTDGTYKGIGVTIKIIDSLITITDIAENSPAYKAGIRIGDNIIGIDSLNLYKKRIDDLNNYSRNSGKTNFNYIIKRVNDTISFELEKENVYIEDLPICDVIDDNIAYMKIESFSKNIGRKVRDSLRYLKNNNNLEGIIIDLRDNPGGLLFSAVELSEMFLPENSLVLSTKRKQDSIPYITSRKPYFKDLPVVVIINENSASASEIFAGAIQDNDRGVIIGKTSFGKGLVQSVFDLENGGNIKITTSKYYTPSGRCLQRIKFAEDYRNRIVEKKDTNLFYTKNGRIVKEATGIIPDSIITANSRNQLINDLMDKNIFFNFATHFSKNWNNYNDIIFNEDLMMENFNKYLTNKNYYKYSYLNKYIVNLKNTLSKNQFDRELSEKVNDLDKSIKNNFSQLIARNREEILMNLRIEIIRRFVNRKDKYKLFIKNDKSYKIAINLIKSKKYKQILAHN